MVWNNRKRGKTIQKGLILSLILTSAVSEAMYLNSHYVLIISNNVNN